ncbi:MAG: prepilin-type N-terminal cleavage/methylation domain-containing protein [Candidatus Krumholzibacteria bacterium]|nr:prepilin-type N-terminal cleavage/methylation domain-containing protein [Candidatus Krumholzibacteria bacterium]
MLNAEKEIRFSNKGVGLVEIIIAMLIFAVGITAALRTLPDSNRATSRSRNLTIATNLAQQKIEELMGAPYSNADLNAGAHTDPDNPIETIFSRAWSVTDNVPLTDMKQVIVTVTYDSGSKDNSVTLTTYLTSRR